MIQCPNCEKGLLWGIYLDIPPEMKAGFAEWIACEPPETDAMVTCPNCQQEAGIYRNLYSRDSESRKQQKRNQEKEIKRNISVIHHPELLLFGCLHRGNYYRENFIRESWEIFSDWLPSLHKERIIPKSCLHPNQEEEQPIVIGIRLDHPENTSVNQCRYFTAIAIAETLREKIEQRLKEPDYNDPKDPQILIIPEGLYAQTHFQGKLEELAKIHRYIEKTWMTLQGYIWRNGPSLEFHPTGRIHPSSAKKTPEQDGETEFTLLVPLRANPDLIPPPD